MSFFPFTSWGGYELDDIIKEGIDDLAHILVRRLYKLVTGKDKKKLNNSHCELSIKG